MAAQRRTKGDPRFTKGGKVNRCRDGFAIDATTLATTATACDLLLSLATEVRTWYCDSAPDFAKMQLSLSVFKLQLRQLTLGTVELYSAIDTALRLVSGSSRSESGDSCPLILTDQLGCSSTASSRSTVVWDAVHRYAVHEIWIRALNTFHLLRYGAADIDAVKRQAINKCMRRWQESCVRRNIVQPLFTPFHDIVYCTNQLLPPPADVDVVKGVALGADLVSAVGLPSGFWNVFNDACDAMSSGSAAFALFIRHTRRACDNPDKVILLLQRILTRMSHAAGARSSRAIQTATSSLAFVALQCVLADDVIRFIVRCYPFVVGQPEMRTALFNCKFTAVKLVV